jgi:hypothetical protein
VQGGLIATTVKRLGLMHLEKRQIRQVQRRASVQARRRTERVHQAANVVLPPFKRADRKIPLRYVVIGVALYCAVAWSVVIVGVNAGMNAMQKQPASYANSDNQARR